MNNEFAKKLIDLYLDGHLDVDLATEFREAMRLNPELDKEVNELRATRAELMRVYGGDAITHDENHRIYLRIMKHADPGGIATHNPAGQLEIPWSQAHPE
jgi:hypothetical protein